MFMLILRYRDVHKISYHGGRGNEAASLQVAMWDEDIDIGREEWRWV